MTEDDTHKSTRALAGAGRQGKTKGVGSRRSAVRASSVARGSGVALWRQIAEDLETEIVLGQLHPGTRLPTEAELAERFGVNRHTLRRALAELAQKGLVDAAPRRGTFVANTRIPYRIGRRTRFSENILRAGREPGGRPISSARTHAPAEMVAWLEIDPQSEVICIRHVRVANDVPVCLGTHWYPASRFGDIGTVYAEAGSITEALARLGVSHYERKRTRVTSRAATREERELLALGRGASVLVVESLDVDEHGEPISAGHACFAAERVELMIED